MTDPDLPADPAQPVPLLRRERTTCWPYYPSPVAEPPGFPFLLVGAVLGTGLGAVLPFAAPDTAGVAFVGIASAVLFPLLLLALISGSGPAALDGNALTVRGARGPRTVDLGRLQAVHGRQVYGRDVAIDALEIYPLEGRAFSLSLPVDWRPTPLLSTLLNERQSLSAVRAAFARVGDLVASGQVPVVTEAACRVLGLPEECARPGRLPPQARRMLPLVVLGFVVLVCLLIGYVQLLSTIGLAEPVF